MAICRSRTLLMIWATLTCSVKIAASPALPAGRDSATPSSSSFTRTAKGNRLHGHCGDRACPEPWVCPNRQRLQHALNLAGIDLAGTELEREFDRLARLDVARIDLRDLHAHDRRGRVDEGHDGRERQVGDARALAERQVGDIPIGRRADDRLLVDLPFDLFELRLVLHHSADRRRRRRTCGRRRAAATG